ncbi:acetyl-CoA carboxylase biotin carboxylase subunit [Halomonas sp.]|uniref:acetyl-CoA carboxylase biotin carboxylase subunit n=1 Tax=Halomonas sp. TaxID=1486246 RepID=UPI003A93FBCC
MFNKVLIANRGEIAQRIQRACHELGLKTVVVFSEADRGATYIDYADEAICIGPAPSSKSYLDKHALLRAAHITGADAIHPGYGFLSENSDFAALIEKAGLIFIGPSADAISMMGDKITAKQAMQSAGVPCVPGSGSITSEDPDVLHRAADDIGYPLIIKAAGGGGGRGMRVVKAPETLLDSVRNTREEVQSAFENPNIYFERLIENPRHIEIQVLCDMFGHGVHLWARDCSLQRRHQKLLEESPPPGIDQDVIDELGRRCVVACQHNGYHGVGTFEFLYTDGHFYFIEMNTRLQVEHPVTEMVTGIDLVKEQIRVAQRQPLTLSQQDVALQGHAIECRINAENPDTQMPCSGIVEGWRAPGGCGIRVDSHIESGSRVPPYYDSMIAKVIAHAYTREEALTRMQRALGECRIESITSNIALHQRLLAHRDIRAGGFSIDFLESQAWKERT